MMRDGTLCLPDGFDVAGTIWGEGIVGNVQYPVGCRVVPLSGDGVGDVLTVTGYLGRKDDGRWGGVTLLAIDDAGVPVELECSGVGESLPPVFFFDVGPATTP